mgnify:FL=1
MTLAMRDTETIKRNVDPVELAGRYTALRKWTAHWADYALAMTEASTTGIYSVAMPAARGCMT